MNGATVVIEYHSESTSAASGLFILSRSSKLGNGGLAAVKYCNRKFHLKHLALFLHIQ
jgi:hypothetical protein